MESLQWASAQATSENKRMLRFPFQDVYNTKLKPDPDFFYIIYGSLSESQAQYLQRWLIEKYVGTYQPFLSFFLQFVLTKGLHSTSLYIKMLPYFFFFIYFWINTTNDCSGSEPLFRTTNIPTLSLSFLLNLIPLPPSTTLCYIMFTRDRANDRTNDRARERQRRQERRNNPYQVCCFISGL